jgi:endonuclease/exonuclease/phosphatase family metal-dependent hydrolase
LPVSKGTGTEPGLVLIQIDGLSRRQMERAWERGRLPFLRELSEREHYETRTFYSGLPASTPAVQAELYYGARCAVPSFTFFDRAAQHVFTMFTPDCAKQVEARIRCGEALLRGGSSWSNIYAGGAAEEETHFCAAGLGARDLFRTRPMVRALTFPLVHFPSLLKIAVLLFVECFLAFWDLFRGIARGESLVEEFKEVLKRVFLCIGLRELLAIGVKIDAARGLPIIHANFVGYDEQAHRRGPSSAFAHWSLKGIDRVIKNIYRAAHRSARRDYQVWVFSDHGQEGTGFFDAVHGRQLEEVIQAALNGAKHNAGAEQSRVRSARSRFVGERSGARRVAEWIRAEVLALFKEKPFTITGFGPVAHLYLKEPASLAARRELAEWLVGTGNIPGVLIRGESGKVIWIHAGGHTSLPAEDLDFLPHPKALRQEVARDLVALCHQDFAGDLILLAWSPDQPPMSFVNERGAHGGPGPEETQGFVLLPERTRLPQQTGDFLRPSDMRAAALHFLGRQRLPSPASRSRPGLRQLRVMTYNVHGCLGMDGRISPSRIASVIARYQPDLVALQELDFGRARSQRHAQPKLIADELQMHLAFCPTVVEHDEQYGHALLSHFPMRVIRTDILLSGKQPQRVQPRGALWVQLDVDEMQLHLMNTHFGLRRSERLAQAGDLLNRNWIGAIGEDEPLILCGDFNMFPRSEPYRALTRRLRDVQGDTMGPAPLNTFSSMRPMVRIDHIFVSRHFTPAKVVVPRNQLTRVASDHLPLIADLVYQGPAY